MIKFSCRFSLLLELAAKAYLGHVRVIEALLVAFGESLRIPDQPLVFVKSTLQELLKAGASPCLQVAALRF